MDRLHLEEQMLYTSLEDMMLLIAGSRADESSSLVILAITAARGTVVTTLNKRDVLVAAREVRAIRGRVGVFDPPRIGFEDATRWLNPYSVSGSLTAALQ